MQINLNRHRLIVRLAGPALFATLLGMGAYGAMAQNKPDPKLIVDPYNKPYNKNARKEVVAATSFPAPQLEFVGKEAYEINGAKGTRYKLAVTNRASLPDSLWHQAANLPPCGKNENASRTWVEIFGSPGDKRLNGFCALSSSEDLGQIWFAVPAGEKGPPCVYIVMTDRQTGKKYMSNRVCSRSFAVVTGRFKGGSQQEMPFEQKIPLESWGVVQSEMEPALIRKRIDAGTPISKPRVAVADVNSPGGNQNQAVTGRVTGIATDPGNSKQPAAAPIKGGFGNDQITSSGSFNNSTSGAPTNKSTRLVKPDLTIKQFLFPPTNDKALRVQVSNDGSAASGACPLVVTVRKINGTAVGRQTHVNVPALAPGKTVWLVIDVKSILPVNVSLKSTTFKLNVDATGLIAESDESNNEVWHNL